MLSWEASQWGWYAGLPVYDPSQGEYIFVDADPIDIDDLMNFREEMLSSPNLTMERYEVVCTMIESHLIVREAIQNAISF